MAVVALLVEFVARDPDLLGVDDDHEISRVDVWRELRLALAAKRVRDPGGQTAERLTVGIDDVPLAGNLTRLG